MESGLICLLIVSVLYNVRYVEGQCDDTGPLTLTVSNEAQRFTSPNYPSDYPANANCTWRVDAPGTYDKVIINIEDFITEKDNDQLFIYDESTNTQLAKMDTSNRNVYNALVSTGNALRFEFTSDAGTQHRGFQILYFHNDSSTQYPCNDTITVSASEQTLMSPNLPFPYIGNDSCAWSFSASDAILFKIKFMDMQCGGNVKLKIYDGDASGTLLANECETSQVYEFTDVLTTQTSAYIDWNVDDEMNDFYGFMLTFRLDGPETIYTECNSTGSAFTAVIYPKFDHVESPGYSGSSYPSNTECSWYITAPYGYAVEVSFDENSYGIEYNYYCSWDYVIIYDGHNSSTDRVLNRLCGFSVPEYGYRSTDRYMLIMFESDYALEYSGFRLIVTAKNNTNPGCNDNYTEYLVTYNTKSDYIYNNYTYINNITSPAGSYNSYYGYASYASNLELFWLFRNDNTTYYKMVLDIEWISIESSYGCLYDKLILYDGECIVSGILDTLCGYWAKRWDLHGEYYLLHLHTDNSFNYRGFHLNYYAEEVTLTPPPTSARTTTNGPPVEAVVNAIKDALTNYSNENLPVKNMSLSITASLDFYLVGINGIDEVEQKLTSTGQFEVTWHDVSLSWEPTKRQGIVKMLLPQNDLWKPDIALMNGFSKITAMGSSFMFIVVDYDGACLWKPYQIMDSACKVDLTHYPYDRQTCVLKFGTWGSDDSEVVTELGARGLQIHQNFQENAEWRLVSHRTEQTDNNNHKIVEFFLTLERNPQYVSYYMTLPIVMLAYLNVFTFVIPAESGEKTGFSITIFLSFVVLLIITNSSMPENSDTISLYAAYLLVLTMLSAIGLIMCVLQVKVLTLIEWRYPRYSCLKKMVKVITKIRKIIPCKSKKSEIKDRDSRGDLSIADDSDKERLLNNDVSEQSTDEYNYKMILKKKRSVTFGRVDDKMTSHGMSTPENLIHNEQENNVQTFERDTTLFMEYADMRQPTSMQMIERETSLDNGELSKDLCDSSESGNETDSNSIYDDYDQLPESNIVRIKSANERNVISRSSTKSATKTVSFGNKDNDVLTPTTIEHPVTVHISNHDNMDELNSTENIKSTEAPNNDSLEPHLDNEPTHEECNAVDAKSNASTEDNANSLSLLTVNRRQSEDDNAHNKDQEPQTLENNSESNEDCHKNQLETDQNDSDEQSASGVQKDKAKDVTDDGGGLSSTSGTAVERQVDLTTSQSSRCPLLNTADDHNVIEAVQESGTDGPGTLVDSVSIKQSSETVEYKMMRPSSATDNRPTSRGVVQPYASSRPLSRASIFADQRPVSRQVHLPENQGISSIDPSSSSGLQVSRTCDSSWSANQGSGLKMSQRIGLGQIGNEMESQHPNYEQTDSSKLECEKEVIKDIDCTSIKSALSHESVSSITSEDENDEDDVSWSDVVSCSDFVLFVFFMLVTTILTVALFLTMILAN